MAKYCSNCGKMLNDGEVCDCQKEEINVNLTKQDESDKYDTNEVNSEDYGEASQGDSENTSPINGEAKVFFEEVKASFVGLIKKPAEEIIDFSFKSRMSVAIFFIVLQGLISSIFALIVSAKYDYNVDKGISAAGSFFGGYKKNLEVSIVGNFFATWIYSIIISFLLASVIFIVFKLLKADLNYKDIVCLTATKCVPIMILDVLACVLLIFGDTAGTCVFILSGIIGLIYVICGINLIVSMDDNSKIHAILITALVFIILLLIFIGLTFETYLPDVVKQSMKQMNNLNKYK